jgi:hypothetical protein
MKRTIISTGIALALGGLAALVMLLLLGSSPPTSEAQGADADGYDTYLCWPKMHIRSKTSRSG